MKRIFLLFFSVMSTAMIAFQSFGAPSIPASEAPITVGKSPEPRTSLWLGQADFQIQTIGAHGQSWLGASLYRKLDTQWLLGLRPLTSLGTTASHSLGFVARNLLENPAYFFDYSLTRYFDSNTNEWLLGATFGREFKIDSFRITATVGIDGWDALISRNLISHWFSPRVGFSSGWLF